MNNFLEIKAIHGNIMLILIDDIQLIREGVEVPYNFIILKNGNDIRTYESIESIKEKIK